jgi:hypothetical protein
MDLTHVGEIIASREFESISAEGRRRVILHLGKPQPFPDSSGFF